MIGKKNNISKPARLICALLMLLLVTGFSKKACAGIPDTAKLFIDTTNKTAPDTTILKKHFWRASGEWMLAQLIPWSYNYFVRHADFAKISFQSIGHNLKPSSWEWDDNAFSTNQIGHPYQGNLYYNSFRSNGYSFWQSVPAAFAGSFVWETCGETHNPAPNDFINTSVGGIILGEMTYRIANHIINKKERGFKRQMDEVFAFLLDPMNGLTRITNGQWGRVSSAPETDLDTMHTISLIDFGARTIGERNQNVFTKGKVGWYASFRLQYGDPLTESHKPFNNFDIRVELGDDDSTKLNIVRVNGLLSSWGVGNGDGAENVFALTANYDFYHNSEFEYGAQSVNMSWYSKFNAGDKVTFITRLGAGAVILAAIPDAYLYYGEGRNYDYGPGFSLLGSAAMFIKKFTVDVNYHGGWFDTLNGSNSSYFLHAFSAEARYRVIGNFSVAAAGGYFILHGYYSDYDDINKKYPFLRLSIGYRI